MSRQVSILKRPALYWRAPQLSGQASYGGVLKSVILVFFGTLGISVTATLFIMFFMVIAGYDGSLLTLWSGPAIVTVIMTAWTYIATIQRRDILNVLWESWKIERADRDS